MTDARIGYVCTDKGCQVMGEFFACTSFVFISLGTVGFLIGAPKISRKNDEDLNEIELYNDPSALCNTPASSYIEENIITEPISSSFQILKRKLSSVIEDSVLIRSAMY